MKLRIFYSWQTSTNTKFNKNFIHTSIKNAVKKLKETPETKNVEFEILEGVTGEVGSVPVATKIADERIPKCDIFIADLSVVNNIFPDGIPDEILIKLKESFKPFQNNNVLYEYGVAYNALGVERIIGILNKAHGSPKSNPENIPFDLRHLRFPIEYEYSDKTEDKAKPQKELEKDLVKAIKEVSIFALQHQRQRHRPFASWKDWEQTILTGERFIPNKKTDEIKFLVLEAIKTSEESVRIIGLSGLGKTRILLEVFRPEVGDENSIIQSSRFLYVNCNLYPNVDFQSIFSNLLTQEDRILILDNCSMNLHRRATSSIKRESSKLFLITIDSNPEEIEHDKINGVQYIVIKKEELTSIVDDILKRDFSNIGSENIEKIKEFSQGIPLMAVLLGESVKNGEKFIGKLDDKELLNKLLGAKGQVEKNRTILKACSIFNYFGFYDELETQVQFIAKNKNITSLDGNDTVIVNDFHEVCEYYLKREIFEKRGRFIGMRPFPLAISLAQEWLEPCTPQRLINVISDISNLSAPNRHHLSEALAEQMKYLGYNDKALKIIEKVIGAGSPFDHAEVLNTELGSRLFRSFVEVNPIAVSQNLKRAFLNKSTAELLNIEEGRRNLVWVLEKVCFDKRTFEEGAKIMYAFAVAENESWSNNATGQFLHLFNVILPGTEATLEDRWHIIEWGLNKSEERYFELAVSAMTTGLNYGHFSRTSGAEKQGGKNLADNEPTWKEIAEYWNRILSKLTEIALSNDRYSALSVTAITDSIRTLFSLRMSYILMPYLTRIIDFKRDNWDEALNALKLTRKYEKHTLIDEDLNIINGLIEKLTKRDFISRYLNLTGNGFLDDDDLSYSTEKVEGFVTSLALEFIESKVSWEQTLPILYKNQQGYSFFFGKKVFELLQSDKEKVEAFIRLSLEVIANINKNERNLSIIGGFISEADERTKNNFYNYLVNVEDLNCLLFYFLSIDSKGAKHFELLLKLVDTKKCDLSNFYSFNYSIALSQLPIEDLQNFSQRLFRYGDEGSLIVFELFFNIWYSQEKSKQDLIPFFKTIIYKVGIRIDTRRSMESFKWSHTITSILSDKTESKFARFVNNKVIESITFKNSYHLDNGVQKIYDVLVKNHFAAIWPDLSKALLFKDEQYMKFCGLKNILGSHIGGVSRQVGVLFEGDIDKIFDWCEKEQNLAPKRLAELTPIYGNNNDDLRSWHPIARRLS